MVLPDPEQIAVQLLQRAKQLAPPIELDRVIELWPNLNLTFEVLDGAGYLLDLGALGPEIIVNANEKHYRQRYTIAHELGHLVLKGFSDIPRYPNDTSEKIKIERWCDRFAAELLMPRVLVLNYFQRVQWFDFANALLGAPNLFEVSNYAFRARTVELLPTAIVELEQTESGFEITNTYPLPQSLQPSTTSLLSSIIKKLMPILQQHPEHAWFKDIDTDFTTVQKLIWDKDSKREWLVTFLPSDSNILSEGINPATFTRSSVG